jgi:capsular polysaccharide transport system permease protein
MTELNEMNWESMWEIVKQRAGRLDKLFLAMVAFPTAMSVVYFGFVASDVYISESRFVVRSPERQAPAGLGFLLQGAGFGRAQDDSYSVAEYVQSRDALKVLNEQIGLGKAFASPSVDRISRFAGLDFDDSFEALHRFYQKMVTVQSDSTSAVSVLTVRAFTPTDAVNANRLLLEQSEALVNRLNERGRQDMIGFATAEVKEAEMKAKAAALAVSTYRNTQGVVDPERQATVQLQEVSKLQQELIATTIQVAQLQSTTPANSQIPALRNRALTLRQEMDKQISRVTGGERSLADKAASFQRLALERDIADKQLISALASLESARNEAQRKQVYLERIVQPSVPDVAQEPRRLRSIIATLILGLVAWGLFSMLLAGVREHQD